MASPHGNPFRSTDAADPVDSGHGVKSRRPKFDFGLGTLVPRHHRPLFAYFALIIWVRRVYGGWNLPPRHNHNMVQLIRIRLRVPEYGWTTQKVFHFLNVIVNGVRCLVFLFRREVQHLQPEIFRHILLDIPSLAFLTTYALLVVFWADIYYQFRSVPTNGLLPTFYAVNAVVYAIQIVIWLVLWWKPVHGLVVLSKMFIAGVSLIEAFGFLLYGGRLFLVLKRFPVESKGRSKKLQEIGYVTSICFLCFLVRCVMLCFSAFDRAADLDVLNHPILLMIFYFLVEILPSSLVLFILRKLPPKRRDT